VEETSEEEDTDESKSVAKDDMQEEAKSNSKQAVQQDPHARAADDTSKDSDDSSATYDYGVQVTEEDKQEITSLDFPGSQVSISKRIVKCRRIIMQDS
jgi:hypothetical protein